MSLSKPLVKYTQIQVRNKMTNLAKEMRIGAPEIKEKELTLYSLLCTFCKQNPCTLKDMRGRSRTHDIVQYRVAFARMAHDYFDFNETQIARVLKRSPSTVNHYLNEWVAE
jgi:chromosomal replication initiation ATPase DnaA